jgi:hypothetical protein
MAHSEPRIILDRVKQVNPNLCAWCSCGLESTEKFCGRCGGPNVNYIDTGRADEFGFDWPDLPHELIDQWVQQIIMWKAETVPAQGELILDIPPEGILHSLVIVGARGLQYEINSNGLLVVARGDLNASAQRITTMINAHDNRIKIFITSKRKSPVDVRIYLCRWLPLYRNRVISPY